MRVETTRHRPGYERERYRWRQLHPEVFVQRTGARWVLGVNHLDRTLQVVGYVADLAVAREEAERLMDQYVGAHHTTVAEDRRLATAVAQRWMNEQRPGLTPIIVGEER